MKKAVVVLTALLCLSSQALAAPVNGDFLEGLSAWSSEGDVGVSNEAGFLGDTVSMNYLYQGVLLTPGEYLLEFDVQNSLSDFVPVQQPFAFIDSFFATLFFVDDLAAFDPFGSGNRELALVNMEGSSALAVEGVLSSSPKGEGWSRYSLQFEAGNEWVVPFFILMDLNFVPQESFVLIDNVSITSLGISGCVGECDPENPDLDEDGDGVPNCQEIDEGTDPCDEGSFTPKLKPYACAGPNGFFEQVNIASVLNHRNEPLSVRVEYRDLYGIVRGAVEFVLGALMKQDVIVNDMGLETDSYGTLCVFTDAEEDGAWSGGLTIYKPELDEAGALLGRAFSPEDMDLALYYPFESPRTGISHVPLNTNTIGTDGLGTVANWVRIADAAGGDGEGLSGRVLYFDAEGGYLGQHEVALTDGGRFDFPAHEMLGVAGTGQAQFLPDKAAAPYSLESSRYFYEGQNAASRNFHTAFAVTNRPLSGAARTGRASALENELTVVEIINGASSATQTSLQVFGFDGVQAQDDAFVVPGNGCRHQIAASASSLSRVSSAVVEGLTEPLTAISMIYQLDAETGALEFAYSPPFVESSGAVQLTEFNSFIGHENYLEIFNATDKAISAVVAAMDFTQQVLFSAEVTLAGRASTRIKLEVPADTYGTVQVDSGADTGLVIRNDVVQPGRYVLPLGGRS